MDNIPAAQPSTKIPVRTVIILAVVLVIVAAGLLYVLMPQSKFTLGSKKSTTHIPVHGIVDALASRTTHTYTIDSLDYEVTVISVDATGAVFSVNGQQTPTLQPGDTFDLAGAHTIGVNALEKNTVTFYLEATAANNPTQ